MWRIAIIAIFTIGFASSQTGSRTPVMQKYFARDVLYDPATGSATWSRRGLLGFVYHPGSKDGPQISLLKPDGNVDYASFLFPGGRYYSINGVAERLDGGVEVVGSASGEDGKPIDFIAHTAPNGVVTTITVTTPFNPGTVAVDADGIVWTIGSDLPANGRGYPTVLKRFNPSGILLSTTPIALTHFQFGDASLHTTLRATGGRVAWLASTNEYFEFSSDGRETLHINGPGPQFDRRRPYLVTSFVLADTGQPVIALSEDGGWDIDVWTLDRQHKNTWAPIESELCCQARMLGFDSGYIVATGQIELPGAAPRQSVDFFKISAR